jgi:hypothetical protein
MARRIAAWLMVIALAGCGTGVASPTPVDSNPSTSPSPPTVSGPPASSAAPTGSASASPSAETVVTDWDRTTAPAPDLCPEDAEARESPVFGEPVDSEGGLVRHSLVANDQGELFRIDVTGPDDTFVVAYLKDAKFCLDLQFMGAGEAEGKPGEPAPEEPPGEPLGREDLIIEADIVGFVDPDAVDPRAIVAEIGSRPVETWGELLAGFKATPDVARPDDVRKEYMIDAVIDPLVGRGTHQYRERSLTRIYTKISVIGGNVQGGLCRNSTTPFRSVGVGASGSKSMSHSQYPQSYPYDLGVRGVDASNRYRVAASWTVPGWNADYWSPPPSGSTRNCSP